MYVCLRSITVYKNNLIIAVFLDKKIRLTVQNIEMGFLYCNWRKCISLKSKRIFQLAWIQSFLHFIQNFEEQWHNLHHKLKNSCGVHKKRHLNSAASMTQITNIMSGAFMLFANLTEEHHLFQWHHKVIYDHHMNSTYNTVDKNLSCRTLWLCAYTKCKQLGSTVKHRNI